MNCLNFELPQEKKRKTIKHSSRNLKMIKPAACSLIGCIKNNWCILWATFLEYMVENLWMTSQRKFRNDTTQQATYEYEIQFTLFFDILTTDILFDQRKQNEVLFYTLPLISLQQKLIGKIITTGWDVQFKIFCVTLSSERMILL